MKRLQVKATNDGSKMTSQEVMGRLISSPIPGQLVPSEGVESISFLWFSGRDVFDGMDGVQFFCVVSFPPITSPAC